MEKPRQALIAAGGYGSRMNLFEAPSKSLIKIDGETLLSCVLRALYSAGISEVVIGTQEHSERGVEEELKRAPTFSSVQLVRSEQGFRRIPFDAMELLNERFLFLCGHHPLPESHFTEMLLASQDYDSVLSGYSNRKFPVKEGKQRIIYGYGVLRYVASDDIRPEHTYIRNPFIIDQSVVRLSASDNFAQPFSFYVLKQALEQGNFAVIESDFPPEFDTREEFGLSKIALEKNSNSTSTKVS